MREIQTDDAPASIGPFSQGIVHGDTVYVSGQGPIDPDTGDVVGTSPGEQTRQTLENVEAILEAADTSLANVVKTTVFIDDMRYYDAVNEAYEALLSNPYPARSAVEVVKLPVDIDVEIEVIAARPDRHGQ
ncbi:Rid family detoxifying hydrolase [Halocatena salina]|uniref:Rid family detoxifying hydrolase n=1 Tax=Halocatena salina TaxID=2934340 RepID=A0A8U0A3G0_9EURY|nr:Rid family detoxifying hydrolase [Halocatena salina]UPM42978.1 Rid family detoxifying hydrolase [Halocatena salina]